MKKFVFIAILAIGAGTLLWFLSSNSSTDKSSRKHQGKPVPIDWRTLRELDWRDGSRTKRLEDISGKLVRLPGFVVPLEDEQQMVREFLFVPSMQACIHVPPPPPNQMIYVVMDEGFKLDWGNRAFWLEGTLQINEKRSPYGRVSYQMEGLKVKPYRTGRY